MNNILIFGGTGFIGSYLVKYLLNKEHKIIVFKHKNIGDLKAINNDNLLIIDDLEEIKKLNNIDVVYHLASKLPNDIFDYVNFHNASMKLTNYIIDISKKINIKQIIYISTGSVFSSPPSRANKEQLPNPQTHYALAKYICEKLLQIESPKINAQISIIRLPSVFGANDNIGIAKDFYDLACKNKDIEVYGNGNLYRNILHIEDTIEILYKIYLKKDKLNKYQIFEAGSSGSLKLFDIAKLIVYNLKSKSKIIKVPTCPPYNFDVHIDISKVINILDFMPMSIEQGIKKYIKSLNNEAI